MIQKKGLSEYLNRASLREELIYYHRPSWRTTSQQEAEYLERSSPSSTRKYEKNFEHTSENPYPEVISQPQQTKSDFKYSKTCSLDNNLTQKRILLRTFGNTAHFHAVGKKDTRIAASDWHGIELPKIKYQIVLVQHQREKRERIGCNRCHAWFESSRWTWIPL